MSRPRLTANRADLLLLAAGYLECQTEELEDSGFDRELKDELRAAAEFMRELGWWYKDTHA